MDDGDPRDLRSVLAAWALVHELADEGWKAAVARGEAGPRDAPGPGAGAADGTSGAAAGATAGGTAAFVDAVAAQVHREKEALKARLAGTDASAASGGRVDGDAALEALRFEVAEVRTRLESIEATLDALHAHLTPDDEA
ncbi:MAG: hypothetical protein RI554_08640 [Trueperaceae bacterium]|nr:hypothetical protein [Trueperaceae bacterium]